MEQHDAYYRQYVQILREELRPATGCTEPIAIAYAAAKAEANACFGNDEMYLEKLVLEPLSLIHI